MAEPHTEKREFIRQELERGDAVQGRLFPTAGTLAVTAVAAGFVVMNKPANSALPVTGLTTFTLDDWALYLAGLVPLLLVGLYCFEVAHALLVDYYLRDLERAFPTFPRVRGAASDVGRRPMFRSIVSAMASRRGSSKDVAALLFVLGLLAAIATFVIEVAAVVQMESRLWQIAAVVSAIAVLGPSFWVLGSTLFAGRAKYRRVLERAQKDMTEPLIGETVSPERPRPLGRYLLLPRPYDFGLKATLFHAPAIAIGAGITLGFAGEVDGPELLRQVLLLLVGFELLIYQVRYIVNDWHGRTAERLNVFRVARGRPEIPLPGTPGSKRRGAWFVIGGVARLGLGFACVLLSPGNAGTFGVLVVSVVVSTAIYEGLRHRSTARHASSRRVQAWITVGILAIVTVGYGARLWAGVDVGSGGQLTLAAEVLAWVAGSAIGLAGVVLAWTLYGTAYSRIGNRRSSSSSMATHPLLDLNMHLAFLAWHHRRATRELASTWSSTRVLARRLTDDEVKVNAATHLNREISLGCLRWAGTWASMAAVGTAMALSFALLEIAEDTFDLGLLPLIAAGAAGALAGLLASTTMPMGSLVTLPAAGFPFFVVGGWSALLLVLPVAVALGTVVGTSRSSYIEFLQPVAVLRAYAVRLTTGLKSFFGELRS